VSLPLDWFPLAWHLILSVEFALESPSLSFVPVSVFLTDVILSFLHGSFSLLAKYDSPSPFPSTTVFLIRPFCQSSLSPVSEDEGRPPLINFFVGLHQLCGEAGSARARIYFVLCLLPNRGVMTTVFLFFPFSLSFPFIVMLMFSDFPPKNCPFLSCAKRGTFSFPSPGPLLSLQ